MPGPAVRLDGHPAGQSGIGNVEIRPEALAAVPRIGHGVRRDLLELVVYPDVSLRAEFEGLGGFEAPILNDIAEKTFGWKPRYSWRDEKFQP